jgi:thioesterase domain-containing protein/acyl carrier protein
VEVGKRGSIGTDRAGASTVALVQATWAEILDLEAVGPDDDFFELGGHSLVVASAVARLGERLGIDLPMRALFAAPTPAEMATLIDTLSGELERDPAGEINPSIPDWVVSLQREGAGRPVFVFPPGHGGLRALAYEAQVASLVGRHHPFWGFRREHLDIDRARQAGIPAVATEYVRQMRAVQERGPYLLYGTCGGGYLAWEVAKHLLAEGDEIAGILFNEVFLRSNFDELMEGSTPAHISPRWNLELFYRPQALPVDLTLLVSEEWLARRWSESWQRVALGTVETVVISDGSSESIDVAARRRAALAEHIRAWIAKAKARIGDA